MSGGGFGPKVAASPLDLISSLLSVKTGRPVKMTYSREEVFMYSRARHQFTSEYTIGVTKEGEIKAFHNKTVLEGGAYASFGIATVYYAGSLLGGPYRIGGDEVRRFPDLHQSAGLRGPSGATAAWPPEPTLSNSWT